MPIENSSVREYLLQKKAERDALQKENEGYDTMGAISGGLASLGAAFQGKDSIAAASQALKQREDMKSKQLTDFDTGTDRYLKDIDAGNAADKIDREKSILAENDDLASPMSMTKRSLAQKMSPKTDWSKMSGSQVEQLLPTITKLYDIDQTKIKNDLDRADKRETRADRNETRALKAEELSVPKAKQRGLYESGLKAEQQYQKAIADKKEYDPTGVGQFIDNSDWAPNILKNNKAIEAQSAQAAWIEAFLRDASGAAIPPNERGAYAKDFFPQPGDPKEVVTNKQALREQKMQNAALGSGMKTANVSGKTNDKQVIKTQTNPKTGKRRVVYSDGTIEVIGSVAGR